uniref:Ninja-family protein n=1 Tax=Chenopodium quinoa TaxID=63459 RepID=A0A803L7S1_CHEQI
MESLSLEISKYPRDLLQTFLGNNTNKNSGGRNRSDDSKLGEEEEDDEGLNLGLGLSLGGKFGVDKSKNLGGLIRSSSIAGTMPLFREDDTGRRRSEKQRVLKETGGVGGSGGSGGEEKGVEGLKLRARLEREQQCLGLTSKLIGSSMGNFFGSSKPPPPSNNLEVQVQPQQGSSQGSGESQGGTSSDASELESKTHQVEGDAAITKLQFSTVTREDCLLWIGNDTMIIA